jgi:hypothetical protein
VAALARRAVSRPPAVEAARVAALPAPAPLGAASPRPAVLAAPVEAPGAAAMGQEAASPLLALAAARVAAPPAAAMEREAAAWRRPAQAVAALRVAAPLAAASESEAVWRRRVRAAVAARVAAPLAATALRAACSPRVGPAQVLAQQGAVRPAEVAGVPAALPLPWAAVEQAAPTARAPVEMAVVPRKAGWLAAASSLLSGPVLPFRDSQAAYPAVAGREEPLLGLAAVRERQRPEPSAVFRVLLEARHLLPSAAHWGANGTSSVRAAAFPA